MTARKSSGPIDDHMKSAGASAQFLDASAKGIVLIEIPNDGREGFKQVTEFSAVLRGLMADAGMTGVTIMMYDDRLNLEFMTDTQLARMGLARIRPAYQQ